MAVSGNLGRKVSVVDDVLLSHKQEIYPTTSLDGQCIDFNFQMNRNCYVDLRQTCLVLELNLFRGRGYETYKSKEVKKHKEEEKANEGAMADDEREAPIPLVTHVNNILHSNFFEG